MAFATETVDFTGGKVPGAWFSSSTLTYSLPEFCGEAVPSLRLNKDDAYLRSPEFAKASAAYPSGSAAWRKPKATGCA